MMSTAFGKHKIIVQAVRQTGTATMTDLAEIVLNGESVATDAHFYTPLYVLLLQILGAYFAYVFGKQTMAFYQK